jgi:hypothetical protein
MNCEECDWPIISTIRNRHICPQCYHRERGLLRPPTPKSVSRTHVVLSLKLPAELYEALEPMALRAGCSVPEVIRRHLSTLTSNSPMEVTR